MTAFNGRRMKISIDDFDAVAQTGLERHFRGIRSRTLTRNRSEIDATTDDDDGWRKILKTPGLRSMDLSFSGVARQTHYEKLAGDVSSDAKRVVIENPENDFPRYEIFNAFIQSLEATAEHDGLVEFSATLLSTEGPPERFYGRPHIMQTNGRFNKLFLTNGGFGPITADADLPAAATFGLVKSVASSGGKIWATMEGGTSPDSQLFSVDPVDGEFTELTSTGNEGFGGEEDDVRGLALDTRDDPVTHGWIVGDDDVLVRVTLADGDGDQVGNVVNYGLVTTEAVTFQGCVFLNDVLYAIGRSTVSGVHVHKLWSLAYDGTSQGEATQLAALPGFITTQNFQGLTTDGVHLYTCRMDKFYRIRLPSYEIERVLDFATTGGGHYAFFM